MLFRTFRIKPISLPCFLRHPAHPFRLCRNRVGWVGGEKYHGIPQGSVLSLVLLCDLGFSHEGVTGGDKKTALLNRHSIYCTPYGGFLLIGGGDRTYGIMPQSSLQNTNAEETQPPAAVLFTQHK